MIISREEALDKGLNKYNTGKPCVHGHTCGRYTNNKICIDCALIRAKRAYDPNHVSKPKCRAVALTIEDGLPIVTRQEAIDVGLKKYYTGTICKNGHVSEQYVVNHGCVMCVMESQKRIKEKDPIEYRKKMRAKGRRHYGANKEKELERCRVWRSENPDKVYEMNYDWRRRNPEKSREYVSTREARKIDATPEWVDRKAIAEIYATCPPGYEVDHLVPLRNKFVCGLHVPWNLKAVPEQDNWRKSNKFDPDTYVHEFPLDLNVA